MIDFLVILAVTLVVLLPAVLLGGRSRSWRRVLAFFYEETEDMPIRSEKKGKKARPVSNPRRKPKQVYTEMATLQQKIDERRRVVDSNGHSTLYDEYFELVFETRRNETLHLVASRAAFKEIPFNQTGSLTYRQGVLIKFKYSGGLVVNENAVQR